MFFLLHPNYISDARLMGCQENVWHVLHQHPKIKKPDLMKGPVSGSSQDWPNIQPQTNSGIG